MPTTSHLEKLNGPQRKAVTFGEPLPDNKGFKSGPLLIVAGAGTGKTDTLAHRAYEITKKALDEPMGGISQTITQRLSWTGTFHSIGNRLLRHYAKHLKLDPQFSVMDRGDSADMMDSLRQELGLASK